MLITFKQLEKVIKKRGGHVGGALRADLEKVIAKPSRQTMPRRKPHPQVRLLESRRMSESGLVIPVGTVGRMVSVYKGGIIASFGASLVRLPDGQETSWEVVK